MFPGGKLFWDPDICSHWRVSGKIHSEYQGLTLRKGNKLGREPEEVHRREESWMSTRICLVTGKLRK